MAAVAVTTGLLAHSLLLGVVAAVQVLGILWIMQARAGVSLGAWLMELRVSREDAPFSPGAVPALVRGAVTAAGGLILGAGAWVVAASSAWDGSGRQSVADRVAGTIVVSVPRDRRGRSRLAPALLAAPIVIGEEVAPHAALPRRRPREARPREPLPEVAAVSSPWSTPRPRRRGRAGRRHHPRRDGRPGGGHRAVGEHGAAGARVGDGRGRRRRWSEHAEPRGAEASARALRPPRRRRRGGAPRLRRRATAPVDGSPPMPRPAPPGLAGADAPSASDAPAQTAQPAQTRGAIRRASAAPGDGRRRPRAHVRHRPAGDGAAPAAVNLGRNPEAFEPGDILVRARQGPQPLPYARAARAPGERRLGDGQRLDQRHRPAR
jgi:uncharacterized RDD family membrane protein YckC